MRFRDPLEEKERLEKRKKREEKPDREKRSWRERDAQKNRSVHLPKDETPPSKSPRQAFQDKRKETAAKKALDNLFQGKKSKEQEAAWKKVLDAKFRTFSKTADEYIKKFGAPHDWGDLLRLLDHDNASFIDDLLDKMMERAPNETASRRDLLVGKMRVLRMEREEPALLDKMEKYLNQLAELQ